MLPQIIYIVLLALGIGMSIARHGERQEEHAGHTILASIIILVLLAWGGFFDCFFA